jgi:hypothetical protein
MNRPIVLSFCIGTNTVVIKKLSWTKIMMAPLIALNLFRKVSNVKKAWLDDNFEKKFIIIFWLRNASISMH